MTTNPNEPDEPDDLNKSEDIDITDDDADFWGSLEIEEKLVGDSDPVYDKAEGAKIVVPLLADVADAADALAVGLVLTADQIDLTRKLIITINDAATKAETASNNMERYTNQLRWLTWALTTMTLVLIVLAIIELAT